MGLKIKKIILIETKYARRQNLESHMAAVLILLLYCVGSSGLVAVGHVRPLEFDVLLSDINEADLYMIAEMQGGKYLNVSNGVPIFPVEGLVMGLNRRYMVNLLVRRRYAHSFKNVVFMVDTGSPYTFLSKSAMEAMVGLGGNVPAMLRVEIHGDQSMVCYLSPSDKSFADVNLLGMDFLEMKGAQIVTDWPQKSFVLHDSGSFVVI